LKKSHLFDRLNAQKSTGYAAELGTALHFGLKCDLTQDDLKNARQYNQRALEVDSSSVVALTTTALWIDAAEGSDLDGVLGMAQKARFQRPDDPAVANTLTWVAGKKGDSSGASPLLEEYIKKSPDSTQFRCHAGGTV